MKPLPRYFLNDFNTRFYIAVIGWAALWLLLGVVISVAVNWWIWR